MRKHEDTKGKREEAEKMGNESDRSERQMNVFLHAWFSVNYARYSGIILKIHGGRVRVLREEAQSTSKAWRTQN